MSGKARILLACGTFCLSLGSASAALALPPSPTASIWLNVLVGLLLGVGMGLNLAAVLLGKSGCRNRPDSPAST
ncbi:MAG TPA: hypothetical protein VLZ50_01760 [Terracidiphilus sp.]|nr:hypothetical protein [Terracidiphilus sp.]